MRLYDSLQQQKVAVNPPDGIVRMYVCGITPYDTTHMGHARTYVVFDVIRRVLEWEGLPVRYVQNVTDIDDDILRKSAELGLKWDELGDREVARFLNDLDALNVLRPDFYVKATSAIDEIVSIAQGLLEQGLAYERQGNVYFAVQKDPGFGELAHSKYAEMLAIANERGNYPNDPLKGDPLDFVLWQAAKPGEPTWDSPWGAGRPGWHIECTALVLKHLGPHITIHGGGSDLQFPHHTCEIAQAENFTGHRPHSDIWSHIGMVHYEGEKMSKSLGNLVLARDLLREYKPDAIRLALLKHHYREAYEFTIDDVEWGGRTLERLQAAVSSGTGGGERSAEAAQTDIIAALDDDFNTPECLYLLIDLAEAAINGDIDDADLAAKTIRDISGLLGLDIEAW